MSKRLITTKIRIAAIIAGYLVILFAVIWYEAGKGFTSECRQTSTMWDCEE